MKEIKRTLRIDAGTDYIDSGDNIGGCQINLDTEISSLSACLYLSKFLNKPVKLIWDILLDNEKYKQVTVATFDYKKFHLPLIKTKSSAKKKEIINPSYFESWSNIIKNI